MRESCVEIELFNLPLLGRLKVFSSSIALNTAAGELSKAEEWISSLAGKCAQINFIPHLNRAYPPLLHFSANFGG